MKLKLFDRLLLTLTMLVLIAVAAVFIMMSLGYIGKDVMAYCVELAYYGVYNKLIVAGIGIVLFLIAVRLIYACWRRIKAPAPRAAKVKIGESGAVLISNEALNAMIQRYCRQRQELKDLETAIFTEEEGMRISIKAVLMPEVIIPEFVSGLQAGLKEYVERCSGVNVTDIGVLVVDALPKRNG